MRHHLTFFTTISRDGGGATGFGVRENALGHSAEIALRPPSRQNVAPGGSTGIVFFLFFSSARAHRHGGQGESK